ncbi:MAG: AmmeMemoRadiSam system protein B [Anaerolineae bacterium]|nr:AmmeMemoRadiSam system protein B [Anaerolineae bacterium]
METYHVRRPAVAGTFYPQDADRLQKMIEGYMAAANPAPLCGVRALIVPHAGYIYSGPIAAFGFKLLAALPQPPARVFLLGPAHRVWFQGVAVPTHDAFATPLGALPLDRPLIKDLVARYPEFLVLAEAHTREHCLEVQLPFLQSVFDRVSIAPLLFGEVNAARIGHILCETVGDDDIVVVSSDLSHYHDYHKACQLDHAFVDAVLRDARDEVAQGEACGQGPILALMTLAAERGWRPQLLDYRNSGDTAGDRRQVVGYASIAYHENSPSATTQRA